MSLSAVKTCKPEWHSAKLSEIKLVEGKAETEFVT